METKHGKDDGPWYKQRWPWLLMIGPLWVVVGAVIMITLAARTPDALVVDDYYKRGKAINQDLRRDRAAAEMGLAMELRYSPASGHLAGRISAAGAPVSAPVQVQLVHSTQPEKDLALSVTPGAGGVFSVALPMLERARWQVVVEGERRDWRLAGEWKWPEVQSVMLVAGSAHSPRVE